MNEFVLHLKRLNIKKCQTEKEILEKFQNSMVIKDFLALVVIFFSSTSKKKQK